MLILITFHFRQVVKFSHQWVWKHPDFVSGRLSKPMITDRDVLSLRRLLESNYKMVKLHFLFLSFFFFLLLFLNIVILSGMYNFSFHPCDKALCLT